MDLNPDKRLPMNIIIAIVILLFSSEGLVAQDKNVTRNYPFRDISKPIVQDDRFEKIIILSAPRVGSTLLHIIFQYIFEDQIGTSFGDLNKKVIKAHNLNNAHKAILHDPKTYVVIPIRNPIDSFFSYVKALNNFNPKGIRNMVRGSVYSHLRLNEIIETINPDNLLLFRYEEFQDNFSVIFEQLESRFQIRISESEKQKMSELFSKEAINKICQKFPSFAELDPVTGLHGKHISPDTRTLEEVFSEDLVEEIHEKLAPISALFGY